jgi:proteasome lid subunit RPN8/RPN11
MLTIARLFLNQMLDYVQACYPLEGCGLLAGNEKGVVTAVYPIDNILQSPTAYEMDPQQQIEAMLALEAVGWRLLAIYHSHPQGPVNPSKTDIALAYYPDTLHIIISLYNRAAPVARAFQIAGQEVVEQKIKVTP